MAEPFYRMHVVMVSDEKYHDLSEFAIAALALNHVQPLSIHLYRDGYDRELNRNLLEFAARAGHGVDSSLLPGGMLQPPSSQLHTHISRATLLKANAIELHAPKAQHLVFVDGDVLACAPIDLSSVFGFDTTAAGVFDFVSYMDFDDQNLLEHTRRQKISSNYFNAGVLFVDAERWLQRRCFSRFIDNVGRHSHHCPYRHNSQWRDPGDCKGADQCALNMTLADDWTPLDFEWNVQKTLRHVSLWRAAKLRHYTGFRKFLATSNVNRDKIEAELLKRIVREVRLPTPEPIHYDAGVMFLADAVKYWRETQGYKRVLGTLAARLGESRVADATTLQARGLSAAAEAFAS